MDYLENNIDWLQARLAPLLKGWCSASVLFFPDNPRKSVYMMLYTIFYYAFYICDSEMCVMKIKIKDLRVIELPLSL